MKAFIMFGCTVESCCSKAVFLLLLLCLSGPASNACAQDLVILKDGRRIEGKIFKQDETGIYLDQGDGEVLGILQSRVERIEKVGADMAKSRSTEKKTSESSLPLEPVPAAVNPAAGLELGQRVSSSSKLPERIRPVFEQDLPQLENPDTEQEIFRELQDLGHPQKDKRRLAMIRAEELGFRAVPVLLALLHPKQRADRWMRIGALRALAKLGPLEEQGAKTLGWTAMKDSDPEVRREAAESIRILNDHRSISYLVQFAISEDRATQVGASLALREINDDRAFGALASRIPQPKLTMNAPDRPTSMRQIDIPGRGGIRMPIFLPEGEVQGTAENVSSPMADALKIIAGKDLGGLPGVWINWLREKVGVYTKAEREQAYQERSMLSRTGSPHAPTR